MPCDLKPPPFHPMSNMGSQSKKVEESEFTTKISPAKRLKIHRNQPLFYTKQTVFKSRTKSFGQTGILAFVAPKNFAQPSRTSNEPAHYTEEPDYLTKYDDFTFYTDT